MSNQGFVRNGTCYIDGSKGNVVNQRFADGTIKTVCIPCYKSLNPVEIKEPEVKLGKKYWGQLPIEKKFTEHFSQNAYRWHDELIAYLKGPTKCCLLGSRMN